MTRRPTLKPGMPRTHKLKTYPSPKTIRYFLIRPKLLGGLIDSVRLFTIIDGGSMDANPLCMLQQVAYRVQLERNDTWASLITRFSICTFSGLLLW